MRHGGMIGGMKNHISCKLLIFSSQRKSAYLHQIKRFCFIQELPVPMQQQYPQE